MIKISGIYFRISLLFVICGASFNVISKDLPEEWFEIAGISSSSKFKTFFDELIEDVECGNADKISEKVNFPINVKLSDKRVLIKSKEEFLENYKYIFNAKVKKDLLNQKFKKIRRKSDGAMIGRGSLWITEVKTKEDAKWIIKIYAINN